MTPEDIFREYSGELRRFAAWFVGADDADDVVQLIMEQFLRRGLHYEDRGMPFRNWLLRVARNTAIDERRRQARHLSVGEPFETEHLAADLLAQSRLRIDLLEALEVLSERQAKIFSMRFLLGMTPTEIAESLAITRPSVQGHLHQSRRLVIAELERRDSTPVARTLAWTLA